MWPFRRKKKNDDPKHGLPCSYCGSRNTAKKSYHGSEESYYIKTWRGQRYVTCICLNCQRDFYAPEPSEGIPGATPAVDTPIEDEDELRAAEEELRRQIEEDNDRRYRP
jgi:hypothetical protein